MDSHLILYKFQTYGAVDHVWAVLQSPGPKYKVFQSYNMGKNGVFQNLSPSFNCELLQPIHCMPGWPKVSMACTRKVLFDIGMTFS